jgi:hypothetical protein
MRKAKIWLSVALVIISLIALACAAGLVAVVIMLAGAGGATWYAVYLAIAMVFLSVLMLIYRICRP